MYAWLEKPEGSLYKNHVNTISLPSSATRAICASVPGRVKEPRNGAGAKAAYHAPNRHLANADLNCSFPPQHTPFGTAECIISFCTSVSVYSVHLTYELLARARCR